MKITNIEKGMKVRIHNDLSTTEKMWTLDEDGDMLSIRRKIVTVLYIDQVRNAVTIQDVNHNESWVFSSEDLSLPTETPPIEPVMFDPTNIEML